ncbi:hypothetical protein MARPO_0081s0014 [Marchantia polymorpha]|uniref:Uncharacterized protein n=1 Tax=Marchantia polymorpha TaxID=3197 RepID=A0A2R6WKA4_MARPO|nr:hypothetical protein MARPO_0081s0014 [Marchantia polymorpha]|eukprot:PTQ34284.1 hypothetical protein MARPO_0081s0014 [Marchantia polymorpha]
MRGNNRRASCMTRERCIVRATSPGCTLPWWTFVLGADYFNFRYPMTHFLRLLPLVYLGPWLLVYCMFTALGRQYTSWARINIGLMISIFTLIVLPVMDGFFIKGDRGTTATFWVTIAVVALAGAGDAVAQGSLLGISSELPERFTHAYVCGSSFSGIFMFIVRVITKASLNSSPSGLRIGAIIYFSIGPLFLIGVLSLFAYVHYMPAMGYYDSLGLGNLDTVRLLVEDEATVTVEIAASAGIAAIAAGRSSPTQPLEYGPVLSRVKLLVIGVAITSLLSMTIFPGFLAETVHSKYLGSWYPILLIGTYVVFDFLGRFLTRHSTYDRQSTLFGASWARLLLLLFFVFSVFGYGPVKTPMVFTLTAVLGITNGFLIACFNILIPRCNPSNQAESAGIIMVTFMTLGSLIGAGLSWLWVLV